SGGVNSRNVLQRSDRTRLAWSGVHRSQSHGGDVSARGKVASRLSYFRPRDDDRNVSLSSSTPLRCLVRLWNRAGCLGHRAAWVTEISSFGGDYFLGFSFGTLFCFSLGSLCRVTFHSASLIFGGAKSDSSIST